MAEATKTMRKILNGGAALSFENRQAIIRQAKNIKLKNFYIFTGFLCALSIMLISGVVLLFATTGILWLIGLIFMCLGLLGGIPVIIIYFIKKPYKYLKYSDEQSLYLYFKNRNVVPEIEGFKYSRNIQNAIGIDEENKQWFIYSEISADYTVVPVYDFDNLISANMNTNMGRVDGVTGVFIEVTLNDIASPHKTIVIMPNTVATSMKKYNQARAKAAAVMEVFKIILANRMPIVQAIPVVQPTEHNAQPANTDMQNADLLIKYKEMLDNGVITQEEFEVKKKQILGL